MKTIGIITIYDLNNYGNRLQNYAVQKVLTDMGFSVKTFSERKANPKYDWKYGAKKRIHELTHYTLNSSHDSWALLNHEYAFEAFTQKYLPTEKVTDLDSLSGKADYFVVGSDQVWNPNWFRGKDWDMYLLTFAMDKQKICFSPSFGIEELKEEWKPKFKKNLQTFPKISVREHAGANIIKQLTGRDAQVMIDPTLMLDAEDWLRIAKKPYGVDTNKPFILTYFLGQRPEQAEEDITELLKQHDYSVYHLLDKSQLDVYACGPSEFLFLFSKADLVLTDSFHACVFSFLFDKPFLVYDRKLNSSSISSRIESLLTTFKLEQSFRNKANISEALNHDYREARYVLFEERKKATDFLRSSLLEV